MTKLLVIRLVAILVGLGFALVALYSFLVGIAVLAYAGDDRRACDVARTCLTKNRAEGGFSFDGLGGKWDYPAAPARL